MLQSWRSSYGDGRTNFGGADGLVTVAISACAFVDCLRQGDYKEPGLGSEPGVKSLALNRMKKCDIPSPPRKS